ncbi:MAG: hypothetical protein IJW54_04005 [Clostridia bacterium]|nr:hypothetical protein [Clostridia bacterium]
MKTKIKLLFTLAITILAVFVLCFVSSAKEITVGSEGCDYTGVNNAVSNASDGDTIIIKTDVSGGTISWTKSLTYILEANWTNIGDSNAAVDTAGKTISVYARGGNRTMSFKGDCLFNAYGGSDTTGTIISFGGEEDYILKLDVSGVTRRFLYGFTGATVNFYKGTHFTGGTFTTGEVNIDCNVFNMYDGAEIYGNREWKEAVIGFIVAREAINIYGGKIYGNVIKSGGYAMIRCEGAFNMYGGEIYNNYNLYASSGSDHGPGLINAVTQNIYGGKIYNNYQAKGSSSYGGTVFGSRTAESKADKSTPCHAYFIDSCVYGNYCFKQVTAISSTNFDTYFETLLNGAYNVKDKSFMSIVDFQRTSKGNETLFNHSAIFFTSDALGVVEAFMINSDGTLAKAYTGTTEIAIPSNYSWTTKSNYCEVVTPVTDAQGTYYVAVAHIYAEDDHNCETGDICSVCNAQTEGMTHKIVEAIVYANGVFEAGVYTHECTNEGCTAVDESKETAQLFKWIGYSRSEIVGSEAIMNSFGVNRTALEEYNKYADEKITEYGLTAARAEAVTNGDIFASSTGVSVDFTNRGYDVFEIKVSGLIDDTKKGTALYVTAYIEIDDAIYYAENGKLVSKLTESINYNSIS